MKATSLIALLLPLAVAACGGGGRQADTDTAAPDTTHHNIDPDDIYMSGFSEITFAFTGDMMLGTDWPEDADGAYLPVDSGKNLLSDCLGILRRADIACGNLEGVLGHGGTAKECVNPELCYTFRMPEYMVDRLKEAGFDYMNLANNHMNDFGSGGLKSTMRVLRDAGIAYGGVKGQAPYAILRRQGLNIGITGFSTSDRCPSVHDYDELRSIISELKRECRIVVVSLHAGGEGKEYTHVTREKETFHGWPRGDVYRFAHTAIDEGADIVWGHGPHVMRGIELYKDRLIMYSLGNFCTPYKMGLTGISGQSAIAEIRVNPDGEFQMGFIHSFRQEKGEGPRFDRDRGAVRQIIQLSEEDFPESQLSVSDKGIIWHKKKGR